MALFVDLGKADISAVQCILKLFGDAFGLQTSFQKCVAYPVACNGNNIDDILQEFRGPKGAFACRYLGLPLGTRKPRKIQIQPLLDRAVGRLKGWKGKMMNMVGRRVIINSVLTATSTYFLTVFQPDKWMNKKLDKIRRSFL